MKMTNDSLRQQEFADGRRVCTPAELADLRRELPRQVVKLRLKLLEHSPCEECGRTAAVLHGRAPMVSLCQSCSDFRHTTQRFKWMRTSA
jgi:hypothetical protein